ncbi:hypothetical protein BG015_008658 [Linnemannia schmuckeri]|uniref:Uncharacterized protein n=1 Tax=Linnemannia schmuckeri TaxID=64567 RepID=A0A9P5RX17_9FUNG|nr:hypothetical protein BG015_008658 [Linnemannia schmuckeri]
MRWPVRVTATDNTYGARVSLAQDETLQAPQWANGLVPLKHIMILLSRESIIGDIDNIVHAFDQTLKMLHVTPTILDNSTVTYIGQRWVDLPVLASLHMVLDLERLVVDPQLLVCYPHLTDLWLQDNLHDYSCKYIIACLLAHLGRLGRLHLRGWPALTFDPATLTSTPSLIDLTIEIQYDYNDTDFKPFNPLTEELNQPYDIQTGSAASISRSAPRTFRMLHGCPALEDLSLDIRSSMPGEHVRFISEADLSVPTSNSRASPSSAVGCLCLPSLRRLDLSEEWVIDESVEPQLFAKAFPGVKKFSLTGRANTTRESLFKLFRIMPTTCGLVGYYGEDEDEDENEDGDDTLAVRIVGYGDGYIGYGSDHTVHYCLSKNVS